MHRDQPRLGPARQHRRPPRRDPAPPPRAPALPGRAGGDLPQPVLALTSGRRCGPWAEVPKLSLTRIVYLLSVECRAWGLVACQPWVACSDGRLTASNAPWSVHGMGRMAGGPGRAVNEVNLLMELQFMDRMEAAWRDSPRS